MQISWEFKIRCFYKSSHEIFWLVWFGALVCGSAFQSGWRPHSTWAICFLKPATVENSGAYWLTDLLYPQIHGNGHFMQVCKFPQFISGKSQRKLFLLLHQILMKHADTNKTWLSCKDFLLNTQISCELRYPLAIRSMLWKQTHLETDDQSPWKNGDFP